MLPTKQAKEHGRCHRVIRLSRVSGHTCSGRPPSTQRGAWARHPRPPACKQTMSVGGQRRTLLAWSHPGRLHHARTALQAAHGSHALLTVATPGEALRERFRFQESAQSPGGRRALTAYSRVSHMSRHRNTRPLAPLPRYLMTTYWLTNVTPRSLASLSDAVSLAARAARSCRSARAARRNRRCC